LVTRAARPTRIALLERAATPLSFGARVHFRRIPCKLVLEWGFHFPSSVDAASSALIRPTGSNLVSPPIGQLLEGQAEAVVAKVVEKGLESSRRRALRLTSVS